MIIMKTLTLVLFSLFLVLANTAQACDFCMLGQGISPYLTATGKGLTLDVNSVVSDHVYNHTKNISDGVEKESWLIYSLTGFYPVTDDLTILVTLPYASKNNIDLDEDTGMTPGTLTSGIGDLTVTGRYTLWREHSLESTLIAGALGGVKFPTGSTNDVDSQGNPVDRHALPGTGSFDYQLGFTGSYALASGFQLTLDTVYSIAGKGSWNGRDHQYGNSLNYSVKVFQRVAKTEAGASFTPFLGFAGESIGKETGTQMDVGYDPLLQNQSSGGTVLYAQVGLYSVLSQNTITNLSFAKAFYRDMNYDPAFDADPAENYKIDFSVTYLF
jgi:hypothetical protein